MDTITAELLRLLIKFTDIGRYVPLWSGEGIGYSNNEGGYRHIVQLGETFYQGMREFFLVSTYSISIVTAKVYHQFPQMYHIIQRERGQWTVYYTSPKSFIITFSYQL